MTVEIKNFSIKPPTVEAVEYYDKDFDELLVLGWVDGKDRDGVYVENIIDLTNNKVKWYVIDGYIIYKEYNPNNLSYDKKIMKSDKFNSLYKLEK